MPHDDHEGYVEAHVRRVQTLRRGGVVERIHADRWHIPRDSESRVAVYDAKMSKSHGRLTLGVLSTFALEAQIQSDGATWLAR
jgi:hypothetical protein